MHIFSGSSNLALAEATAKSLQTKLGQIDISHFADGEICIQIKENVRGLHVFLIQSTCHPVNENYMELFLMLDAFKRASAQEITLVMPYYGYARQDRKSSPRVPISAKCMADMMSTAGANRLLVVDLHSPQIQGFFNIPVDNLFAFPALAKAWKAAHSTDNVVVVSPDAGGTERARFFAKKVIKGASVAMIDKRRQKNKVAKAIHLIGEVQGKTAVILDDMIDTAGTICEASTKLLESGAKEVIVMATHPLFSGSAVEKIQKSPIKEVLVTDSIPLNSEASQCKKIQTVNLAPLMGEAMKRISNKKSLSFLFD